MLEEGELKEQQKISRKNYCNLTISSRATLLSIQPPKISNSAIPNCKLSILLMMDPFFLFLSLFFFHKQVKYRSKFFIHCKVARKV